jgi:hypothetical protein
MISWVLNELEKYRFRHLTLDEQGFFKIQYQILETSSLSAAGPQIRNIFSARFFG